LKNAVKGNTMMKTDKFDAFFFLVVIVLLLLLVMIVRA
jgi:hypothetical protein